MKLISLQYYEVNRKVVEMCAQRLNYSQTVAKAWLGICGSGSKDCLYSIYPYTHLCISGASKSLKGHTHLATLVQSAVQSADDGRLYG